jgi:hypothetical protein
MLNSVQHLSIKTKQILKQVQDDKKIKKWKNSFNLK